MQRRLEALSFAMLGLSLSLASRHMDGSGLLRQRLAAFRLALRNPPLRIRLTGRLLVQKPWLARLVEADAVFDTCKSLDTGLLMLLDGGAWLSRRPPAPERSPCPAGGHAATCWPLGPAEAMGGHWPRSSLACRGRCNAGRHPPPGDGAACAPGKGRCDIRDGGAGGLRLTPPSIKISLYGVGPARAGEKGSPCGVRPKSDAAPATVGGKPPACAACRGWRHCASGKAGPEAMGTSPHPRARRPAGAVHPA